MKTLTVVAPAYNEAESIAAFYVALKEELGKLTDYEAQILFVVDGGTDGTFDILKRLAAEDSKLRVLKLSRNFGHQMALLAGLDHAEGDAVISMDADLQHPPAVIRKLLAEYEKGNEVVHTIREKAQETSLMRALFGGLFYSFVNLISDVPIHENASDFRLLSARVVKILRENVRERDMFLRGIVSWMGFRQASVRFSADTRYAGTSKYSLGRLIRFAFSGMVSFSRKPLRAAAIVGACVALFGFTFAIVTLVQYLTGDALPTGWTTLAILLSLFGGAQLIFLGVLGEYVGAIFDEVKARPRYLIEEEIVSVRKKA